MSEIATTEPSELRAGDTWKWRREDLTDYPASDGWALTYRFRTATTGFEVAAAADGAAFEVEVTPTENGEYAAGEYSWIARVTKASEAYTVSQGLITILPNLFGDADADAALDLRTHAQKMVAAIEAAIEALTLGVKSYQINDKMWTYRDLAELKQMRAEYRHERARQSGPGDTSYVRFVRR